MEGEITPPASLTPFSPCSIDDFDKGPSSSPVPAPAAAGDRLFEVHRHHLLRNLQGAVDRYNDCFQSLQHALAELKLLREENRELRWEFVELSLLAEEKEKAEIGTRGCAGSGGAALYDPPDLRSLGFEDMADKENEPPEVGGGRRLPATDGGKAGKRGSLPKSISIRSTGFLAVKNPNTAASPSSSRAAGATGSEMKLPHRVLLPVPGQGEGESAVAAKAALEVDVYNQGMTKTELCNKWEEMAWCPYRDQCRFAHGIEELRPVIRHPRYKTQLCRMIGIPGGCPYGHRCHFRHAVAQQNN